MKYWNALLLMILMLLSIVNSFPWDDEDDGGDGSGSCRCDLDRLGDVNIRKPHDGDILTFQADDGAETEGSNGVWINRSGTSKRDCACDFVITSRDLNRHSGLEICCPGVYCVCEDLYWDPPELSDPEGKKPHAAITIKSSNVRLRFNGHTLFGHKDPDQEQPFNAVGVLIRNNSDAVQIEGGTIDGFAGVGIWVQSGSRNIQIRDMNIYRSGFNGAFPDPGFNRPFAGGILVAGTGLDLVEGVLIQDCDIADLTCLNFAGSPPAGGCDGIIIIRAKDVRILQTSIARSRSADSSAGIFLGIAHVVLIEDVTITQMIGDQRANGIDSMQADTQANTDVTARRVEVSDITVVHPTLAVEALGFEWNAFGLTMYQCIASNVRHTSAQRCAGIVIQKQTALLRECFVYNITTSTASLAVGFLFLVTSNQTTCIDCIVKNVTGGVNGGNTPITAGFFDQGGVGNQWIRAESEEVVGFTPGSTVAGWLLQNTRQGLVQNSRALRTGRGAGPLGHGYLLRGTAAQNVIEDSAAYDNTGFAVLDQAPITNANVINRNRGFNNAGCSVPFNGTCNMFIAAAPTQVWQIGGPSPGPADSVANLCICPA